MSFYRLRVDFRVSGIIEADCHKDFEDSHYGLEGEVVKWRNYFICMATYKNMWADLLTKDTRPPEALEDILIKNVMNIKDTSINEVKAH